MFRPVVPQARDLTGLPLIEQRALLKSFVAIHDKRIRISAAPSDLVSAARDQGLEGVIGKRKDSLYQRSSSTPKSPGNTLT